MISLLRKGKGFLYQYLRASRELRGLARSSKYDLNAFKKHARVGTNHINPSTDMLEALMIKTYHVLEKGLAMPEFRARFGVAAVNILMRTMRRYIAKQGDIDNLHFQTSVGCLFAYCARHEELGIDISDIIDGESMNQIEIWNETCNIASAGVVEMSPSKLFNDVDRTFADLLKRRVSCRHFDEGKSVDPRLVKRAVTLAIRTPSVCNRQPWRVHAYHDKTKIGKILSCQNGNRGFGHTIPCLLIVSVDLTCFEGYIERYQAWIDGGMFSMSVIYALHSLKLGSVPLNWSASVDQDLQLRQTVDIPDSERVIMLIGTGHPVDSYLAPASQRRDVCEVLSSSV